MMNLSIVKEKILFIGSYLGAKRGTISVAEKLSKKFKDDDKYEIIIVSKKTNKVFRLLEIIYYLITADFSKTFIDTYSGNSFIIAQIAGKILRARGKAYSLIIRGGNFVNYYSQHETRILRELIKANSLISPSIFIIEFFKKKGVKVDYLPNYINQADFPYNSNCIRKPFSLLWVRAFSDIYNPLIPIKIINELKKKYPHVSLTMVGPDLGLLGKVKNEIESLNLGEYIKIVGSVPNNEMVNYYQTHSVYLNTTSFESFGMAQLEAASCGIPIVSTNVGEIPFIYKNGESILLVDNFSINHFVEHIESLFNTDSLANKLSVHGVSVSNNYSFPIIRPLWIKQFQKVKGEYAESLNKSEVLFIGSFLSRIRGTKSIVESLEVELIKVNIHLKLVSKYENKMLRIVQIVCSILVYRGQKIHVDVFSGSAFSIADIATSVARFRNKKIVLTLHGGKLIEFAKNELPRIQRVFKRAHYIQTPSLFLQDYFKQVGFEIHYLPNGIDINKFPYNRKSIKPYSLLWVRAFDSIYNPHIAIHILSRLKSNYPECTLTMVGPDIGLIASTKTLAKELGVNNSVTFTGAIPNEKLYEVYQQHAVYLNTTSFESFGVAIVEAALCGIPIVSNSVGEIPYLWTQNNNILLVNENSIDEYECQISKIFDDKCLAEKLSIQARKVAEGFDWPKIKNDWIKLLEY